MLWQDQTLYLHEIARTLDISIGTLVAHKKLLGLPGRRVGESYEQRKDDPSPDEIRTKCIEIQTTWPPHRFENKHIVPLQTGFRRFRKFN